MSKFQVEKLTDYNIDESKVNLKSYNSSIDIYDNFTKVDFRQDDTIVTTVRLNEGQLTKLWFGIDSDSSPDDENFFPFKNATFNYDAESIKVRDHGKTKICSKSENYPHLPDFKINRDGEVVVLDKFNTCRPLQGHIDFKIKDSGKALTNEFSEKVSFRHAIDVYKDGEKITSYQGKTITDLDGEKFYLGYQPFMPASKNEGLVIIDTEYPNFSKGSVFKEDFSLSNIVLRLSTDDDSNPVINFLYGDEIMNEFDNDKHSFHDLDLLTPIADDLRKFIEIMTV